MARLPQTGRAVACLYERSPEIDDLVERGLVDPRECVTTLVDVIADLGLAPLSPDDEQKVRQALEAIIGCGLQRLEASPKHNPGAKLQARDLQKTLKRVAKGLTKMAQGRVIDSAQMAEIDKTMRGRETGFHHVRDIAAANEIVAALAGIVGDRDEADAMMSDFFRHPSQIAKACLTAVDRLGHIKGKEGRPATDWLSEFVAVLRFIAAANNIKPAISVNPRTGKAQGRFLALAAAVEQLLPYAMRAPLDGDETHEALAQRLKRAL
jgi:hypothetical protein